MTAERAEIGIVGMACRFPGGVRCPDDLWDLVRDGRDAIAPVPGFSRWDRERYGSPYGEPGTAYVQEGGFLDEVGGFDAAFFGISPREAKSMDPQQRIFLEVACEALDAAGVPVEGLRGSSTGVFVGIFLNDYGERFTMSAPELIEPYYMTGNTLSGAACRLAYALGLEGPAMAIDAACASSLVTVHLAARALQAGECDLAIAGGVNLILSPKVSVAACQGHILAPDGRCKAFDQAANGYARSEGCGVVVLKRVTDARADHDRVRAVIAGSAIRHGGRTAGFTVPGSQSQHRLLDAALADAGVAPGAVDYVEAHGTGTPLGDPVEIRALNAVYGAADSAAPCLVGALKTNLGHLETAAGVAGLIKTVMCLEHGQAPPNLHFRALNPAIKLDGSRLRLAGSLTALPPRDDGRHAAVSSFGLTGTIAHVVLREGDSPADDPRPADGRPWLLPLSAKSPEALQEMGAATMALSNGRGLAPLCPTAALRRSHYEHRGAVVGDSEATLRAGLEALAQGRPHPALHVGQRRDAIDHGVVFLFPGQGSQWPGMGTELRGRPYEAFEETLAQCDQLIRAQAGWSVLGRLRSPGPGADITQPLIFAVQVALAALWRSWGIEPDGVIGHSMGEIAAACVAGALDLADAVHLICLRSRLVRALEGQGGMAVVELPHDQVREFLGGQFLGKHGGQVTVAAVNGPQSTVIAGPREPLAAVAGALGADGAVVRTVDVGYASHCGLVESVLPDLAAGLASIRATAPDIPMYSTVTGMLAGDEPLDAAYWQANLRQEVRFWPAVETARQDANDTFVEISPHPILLPGLAADAHRHSGTIVTFPSMRRDHDQRLTALSALSGLYTLGREPHWPALVDHGHPRPLPPYPWQHAEFLLPTAPDDPAARSGLGEPLRLARHPSTVWPVRLVASRHADVSGHRVAGRPLVPFSVLAGLVIQAAGPQEANGSPRLVGFTATRPVPIPPDSPTDLQVSASPREDGRIEITVDSRVGDTWLSCATAFAVSDGPAGASRGAGGLPDLTALRSRPDPTPGAEFYTRAARAGVDYDVRLRVLTEIRLHGDEALATVDRRGRIGHSLGADWTWIEAAVQLAAVLVMAPEGRGDGPVSMPVSLAGCRRLAGGSSPAEAVYARRRTGENGRPVCDMVVLDTGDRPLAELTGLTFGDMGALAERAADAPRTWLRQVRWEPAPPAAPGAAGRDGEWLVLADRAGVAEHLRTLLAGPGRACRVIHPDQDAWANEVSGALGRPGRIAGLIDLTCIGPREPESDCIAHVQRSCLRVLESARMLEAHGGPGPSPRLCLVTVGAQLDESGDDVRPAGAALWGLGRALAQERPGLHSLLLDLDPRATPRDMAEQVSRQLADSSGKDAAGTETVVRAGQVFSPRLVPVRAQPSARPLFRLDGACLVTGGLGDLGLAVARWLACEGARRLLLAGRTPMPPRSSWRHLDGDSRDGRRARAIRELEAAGATVETVELDVCDPAALDRFIRRRDEEGLPAIRGVFHLAATLADELAFEVTSAGLAAVFGAKAGGARLLDRHFPDVDHFVLFSSAAALVPLPGQASYAAANAYLGALARRRRAQGRPGLAVHWSVWDGLGFAGSRGGERSAQFLRRAGLPPLPAEGALEALGLLMRMDVVEAAVLRLSQDAHDPALRRSALFAEPMQEAADARTEPEIVARCRDASPHDRQGLVEEWLQETVGAILGIPAGDIDLARPFSEFGMDSLMAVELRTMLERGLGVQLSATVAFEHPTVSALAGFLAKELAGPAADLASMTGDDHDEEDEEDEELAAVLLAAQTLEDAEQD